MLATFTSMLPAGMGFSSNRDERDKDRHTREQCSAAPTPIPEEPEDKHKDGVPEELGGKKQRERFPHETFIVVRPPPSVSNHPLNLQLQLVPPQFKERNLAGPSAASTVLPIQPDRRSIDDARPDINPEDLADPPIRSNRSDDTSSVYGSPSTATTTSMTSIASTASTTSTLGGRRMIVPLYNLSAHNVMTNTVLDAGTDAKIAKFHKRGMEVLSLAALECIEVWPGTGKAGSENHVTFAESADLVDRELLCAGQFDPQERTPTGPAFPSAGSNPASYSPVSTRTTFSGRLTPNSPQSGAKKFLGKVFRRKDTQMSAGDVSATAQTFKGQAIKSATLPPNLDIVPESITPRMPNPFGTLGSYQATPQINLPASPNPMSYDGSCQPGSAPQITLQPPTLGIQPMLSAPTNPPTGRPTRYVWVVRRWLKGNDNGFLSGVIRGVGTAGANLGIPSPRVMGSGNFNATLGSGQVAELRFEWTRSVSKKRAISPSRNDKAGISSTLAKRLSLTRIGSNSSAGNAVSRRSFANDGERRRNSLTSRPARYGTSIGRDAGTTPSRVSTESLRSTERTNTCSNDDGTSSRTNSMTSASQPDEAANAQQAVKDKKTAERTSSVYDDDGGEDSDPEDSETPWLCSLVISSVPVNYTTLWEHEHSTAGASAASRPNSNAGRPATTPDAGLRSLSPGSTAHSTESNASVKNLKEGGKASERPGTLLRVKIGTLYPTPHHPKVVAKLKVPFPLPDVEVDRARVRRRIVTAVGLARPVLPLPDDVSELHLLTAEEIKDILSCTAFWMVVREGFGGVGKVTRKGDGWRIRG